MNATNDILMCCGSNSGGGLEPVIMDGGIDDLIGMFIPLLPLLLLALVLVFLILGIARRSKCGSCLPYRRLLVLSTTVFFSADITALIWFTGYTMLHSGIVAPNHTEWGGFLINFGNRLAQFAWMVPVATIGYLSAWLLKDKDK